MRNFIAAIYLWPVAACALTLQDPLAAGASATPPPDASFEWDRTGEGAFFYHRVWADCDTLGHGHGRNMAWGRWEMALADVTEGAAEAAGEGHAIVRLTCRDGSACIRQGAHSATTEPVSEHAIPFGTMALARQYTEAVAALRGACGQPA
ncbi:MAG: hypothetical protein ACO33A_15070 [Hyphomonas sp.]